MHCSLTSNGFIRKTKKAKTPPVYFASTFLFIFQLWTNPYFVLCIIQYNYPFPPHKHTVHFSFVNTLYTHNLVRISRFYVIWTQLLWSEVGLCFMLWWKQDSSITHTSDMLTVLFYYGQPYSKRLRKPSGHDSKKVISSPLPEAYSFLLITPVMSPSAHLCHGFTAFTPPSLCRGFMTVSLTASVFLSFCMLAQHLQPNALRVYLCWFLKLGWLWKGEERANRTGAGSMMMKCEGPSSVLSFGKCVANEIAVLNQICSAWVIECCFENRACLSVGKGEGTCMESLCGTLAVSSDSCW